VDGKKALMEIFLEIAGIVAIGLGILTGLWFLLDKLLALRKWIQNRRILKKKERREISAYLNGLTRLLPREKTLLLNEALKAQENYQYEEAIAKFKLLLGQVSDPNERCAILNQIGTNQIKSSGRAASPGCLTP
jgi:hypothetical protein